MPALMPPTDSLPFAERLADLAVRAAAHEAAATGKPGLVCPDSRGAHRDMDFYILLSGVFSLRPYFARATALGMETAGQTPQAVFPTLRSLGKEAEQRMLAATGGINTHKGLIFSLGLFCAAAGQRTAQGLPWETQGLCDGASAFVQGITAADFALLGDCSGFRLPPEDVREERWPHERNAARQALSSRLGRLPTAGEVLYACFGNIGIRGEAEAGFPHLPPAVAVLREGFESMPWNDALLDTLLLLMRDVRDSNILWRGGPTALACVRETARNILEAGGMRTETGRQAMKEMARACAVRGLSPGGSADLLSVALFVALGEFTK